ncbi:MAG: hypothetical protein WCI36_03740 [bacterium]
MSKTPSKPNNESEEINAMFDKLEKGDYSGVENFMSKAMPKLAKVFNDFDPKLNSFTGYIKKDENKEVSSDNIGLLSYTTTDPIVNIGANKRPLQVGFSSVEQDNDQLLHFLFNKSKR